MCSGCGKPREESFDPANEERYDVEVVACHACSARERKAWNRRQAREGTQDPPLAEFYVVTLEED